jgi:copper chaperone CopZ
MQRDILNIAALVATILVLAVGGPVLVRQLHSLPPATPAARSGQRIVTLEVGGMTCPGCARTLETSLARMEGVAAVSVRYPQRRAYVVCGRSLPDSSLIAAVRGAGPRFTAAVAGR